MGRAGATLFAGKRFGQAELDPDQVPDRQAQGGECWSREAIETGQTGVGQIDTREHSADGRSENEAEPEGGSDHSHPLGSILFSGDVGYRRGCD